MHSTQYFLIKIKYFFVEGERKKVPLNLATLINLYIKEKLIKDKNKKNMGGVYAQFNQV